VEIIKKKPPPATFLGFPQVRQFPQPAAPVALGWSRGTHGKRTTQIRSRFQETTHRPDQIAPSMIERWRRQYREQKLENPPTSRERQLEAENQKLKAKIGELVMQNDQLKKLQHYAQRLKNADTSVITAKNLDQFRKDSK